MQLVEDRSPCITDFAFDEWFAGEVSSTDRARIQAHVRSCARCQLRCELLQRDRAAFLHKAPTIAANAELARGGRRAASTRRIPFNWAWPALPGAVLAAAVALFLWLPPAPKQAPATAAITGSGERSKGNAQAGFYVKRGASVRRGASGDTLQPGDRLRFTYSSTGPAYLALLGRDQRATAIYFPAGPEAARVDGGRDEPLDFSLELDDQLGDEQLYLVLCDARYALAPLRAELEAKGELPALPRCRVERIVLHKQAAP